VWQPRQSGRRRCIFFKLGHPAAGGRVERARMRARILALWSAWLNRRPSAQA